MNTTTIPKKRDHNKWNASEKKRQELEVEEEETARSSLVAYTE